MSEENIKILAENLDFPEGPAFDPAGDLWCVEVRGGNLVRRSEDGLTRYPTGGAPSGLLFDRAGRIWVCDGGHNAILRFDPVAKTWETIVDAIDGEPLNKPNDLAFDYAGNLIFTCPGDSRQEPTGYVCCLRPNGILTKIGQNLYFPNGLALTAGGRQLVVAETYRQRLWAGGWDSAAGEWNKPQPWVDLGGEPGPDGMAAGKNGLLYVAVVRAGQVKVVDVNGRIAETYDLPGSMPTNCAFDTNKGRELGLVVTEAEQGQLLSLPGLGPGVELCDGGEAWP